MDLTADRAATRTPLIIVVDDHSTDQTASIANAVDGVVVVGAPDLPIGWTGKSWACWNGVAAAQRLLGLTTDEGGDLQLVFIDADVRMAPGALDVVTGQQRNIGGLLSVQPHHVAVRPYEQLSALFNVIAIMGVGAGHSSPRPVLLARCWPPRSPTISEWAATNPSGRTWPRMWRWPSDIRMRDSP